MGVIERGVGISPTEKNLAALADKIFLNLWTYPNLYNRDGKELCDLLVVCGDDVLIFSDKEIGWQADRDFDVAWPRWYRRAVKASADQIAGAARYLQEHADELYLDATCKQKFPLTLPPPDQRRMHHIAIALGAAKACAEHYKSAAGYFPIDPEVKGDKHMDTQAGGFVRFAIGDVRPDGAFVHLFNEPALSLLAGELDTVTDFTRYLLRRERIVRSGHLAQVCGEHDLLAQYLLSGGPDEEHDFSRPGGGDWQQGEKLSIPAGTFAGLAALPGYKARKEADRVSYVWDRFLGLFTTAILSGDAQGAFGDEPKPAEAEEGLRSMALEPRLRRRLLGASIAEGMKKAEDAKANQFARSMVPGKHSVDDTIGYVHLILAHHGKAPGKEYEEYRKRRLTMLQGYCFDMLKSSSRLKRAVGITMDASSKVTGRLGGSEDFFALEVDKWTPGLERYAQELKNAFGLLQPENVTHGSHGADDFPPPQTVPRKEDTPVRSAKNGLISTSRTVRGGVTIEPDSKWPSMWRVHMSNGQVSDMTNLTRARDAARSF
jgi:hypothetical protein